MMALKIGAKIEVKLIYASMTCRIWETFTCWKITIFLEMKLAELKQNKNWKQTNRRAFVILSWSSELLRNRWHHGHNNRNWLKQPQCYFHWIIPYKSHHFLQFWCRLRTTTPNISISSKNINNTARVFILSFLFSWLWWK